MLRRQAGLAGIIVVYSIYGIAATDRVTQHQAIYGASWFEPSSHSAEYSNWSSNHIGESGLVSNSVQCGVVTYTSNQNELHHAALLRGGYFSYRVYNALGWTNTRTVNDLVVWKNRVPEDRICLNRSGAIAKFPLPNKCPFPTSGPGEGDYILPIRNFKGNRMPDIFSGDEQVKRSGFLGSLPVIKRKWSSNLYISRYPWPFGIVELPHCRARSLTGRVGGKFRCFSLTHRKRDSPSGLLKRKLSLRDDISRSLKLHEVNVSSVSEGHQPNALNKKTLSFQAKFPLFKSILFLLCACLCLFYCWWKINFDSEESDLAMYFWLAGTLICLAAVTRGFYLIFNCIE